MDKDKPLIIKMSELKSCGGPIIPAFRCGAHGGSKKEKSRKNRKRAKIEIKKNDL
jgi:hypothetical protein